MVTVQLTYISMSMFSPEFQHYFSVLTIPAPTIYIFLSGIMVLFLLHHHQTNKTDPTTTNAIEY